MENIITHCSICYSVLNEVKTECPPETNQSTSADPLPLLNTELNVIFTLRNIFELKPNQLEGYLQKCGDPGDWLKFCGKCEEDVNNIRCIYQRLHEISRELERRKCVLQERVMISEREKVAARKLKHGTDGVMYECRRKFCTKYKKTKLRTPAPSENPFERGDLLASELALKVKVEPSHFEENASGIHDYLEMSHDEDQNTSASHSSSDDNFDAESEPQQWSSESEDDSNKVYKSSSRQRNLRPLKQVKQNNDSEASDDIEGKKEVGPNFSPPLKSKSTKRNKRADRNEEKLRISKFGLSVIRKASDYYRPRIKCPFCYSIHPMNEELYSFSKHLQDCAGSDSESIHNLKCSMCKSWSCNSREIREFMEHVVMCVDNHQGEPIPWRHAVFKCNLCEESCYLPFPEYTYHVFSYHQHQYGCAQCGLRARESGKIAGRHWKVCHKNLTDTPTRERYKSIPKGGQVPLPDIPWWCPAPTCLQQFADEASRNTHLLLCENPLPERKFNCSFCGRDYFFEEELLMHRVTVHGYLLQANAHQCKDCNIIFANSRQLSQHLRIQHSLNLFRCDQCGAEFRTNDARGSHVRLEHGKKEELEEFTCQKCDKVFGWQHQLRSHIAKVHEKVAKVCETCGKEFEDEVTWKSHMSSSHPSSKFKPHPCPHQDCQKVMRSALGLKLHLAKYCGKKSKSASECMCSFCGKMFATRRNLRRHTKICRLPRFVCRQCKLRFASPDLLRDHRVAIHGIRTRTFGSSESTLDLSKVTLSEDKLSGSCNICEKSFASVKRLKFHMAIFHDEKRGVMCGACGAKLRNKFRLKMHMAMVHGEGYKCEASDKVFESQNRLERHKKCDSHPEDAPFQQFSCPWESCEKIFKTRQCMNQHLRQVHLRKKESLECPVCQRMFMHKNAFKMHVKSHSSSGRKKKKQKVRSACCEICGKIISHMGQLPRHKARVHGIADFKCDVEGCSKAFLTKKLLEDHKNKGKHEDVRLSRQDKSRRSCQFCEKSFMSRQCLRRHEAAMHLNSETKPFQCDLCGKSFAVKEYLSYHMRYTHKIKKKDSENSAGDLEAEGTC